MEIRNKILLVDDEKDIVDLMEEVLRQDGFRCIKRAYTGIDALRICREFQPDVVVLDIMLPDLDGLKVCQAIREFSFCSVLFLSSKNDDVDKILGLSFGGDDYITKPFSPREVVFRVKAQIRRQGYQAGILPGSGGFLTVGPLSLDQEGCRAYKAGRELRLTAKEFQLLSFLMEHPGQIISKERLYERIWGDPGGIYDNTIMVHIRHLREKIEDDPSKPRQLVTVKGLGYKLKKRVD